MKTTLAAYTNAGFANPKWDGPAQACLAEFARSRANVIDPDEPADEIIATNAEAAIAAGCNDPMVHYLYLRDAAYKTKTKEAIAAEMCTVAHQMENGSYPPVRQCYAAIRALDDLYKVYNETNEQQRANIAEMNNALYAALPAAIADKETTPQDLCEMCERTLYITSGGKEIHDGMYKMMEECLSKTWPDSYVTYLAKGEYYIDVGWGARGNGTADTVTKEGWKGFSKALGVAQDAFEHAWKLNPYEPKIPYEMMTVVLGQGGDLNQENLWFNRAMELNTNNYDACKHKLYYLAPKWYGSEEAMLDFGRECVQSQKWGGRVPLILVDVRDDLNSLNEGEEKANYWKRPEVWADVQSAFDRFFELNPDATGWYHNYAWYAYHAEQWDKLNELLPKLGEINYEYFGGKAEYNKMVQLAKEHSHSAEK